MKDFSVFQGTIEKDFSLASKTTWRVGGNAEFFAIPNDLDDLLWLLSVVKKQGMPVYVLGRGSNLLIDDAGVPGMTIFLGSAFQYLKQEDNILQVGAATPMPALAKQVGRLGFSGYEQLIGIPGTIGAGVVINAGKGTSDFMDMRNILRSVKYISRDLELCSIDVKELKLEYRSSILKGTSNIVVEAYFDLKTSCFPDEVEERHKAIMAERKSKFPLHLPNAGSVFKRPENYPPAGKLIETAGLKGLEIGGAQISPVHANFIVNSGSAKSEDIKNLMVHIKEKVYQVHGVELETEVVFWPDQRNWEAI